MGMKFIKRLPSKEEVLAEQPLSLISKKKRDQRVDEIKAVLEGKDDRFLLIIGPCSADNEESVCDYVEKLALVQEKVKDKLILIPRIYTNKPRTTGAGYKGMAHQPDPNKEPDIRQGIRAIRQIHLRVLMDYGLPGADEMLYPDNYSYLADVFAYNAVGARSVENQQHRLTSSGVDVPIGMKNPTSGDFSVMLNAINAAQQGHRFIYRGYEVESDGNPHAHAILRGAVDVHGRNLPNYHYEDLIHFIHMYDKSGFQNPAIVIDTNHSNSMKKHYEQPRIAKEILFSRKYDPSIRSMVKGMMIESYLVGGTQKIGENIYGKSITDPCLGWEESEQLMYYIADNV
ncbi:3-deoxy-7-phosphoheptulonate synthase [Acidaminobacter sp.]|uniref:3-deoxy-7-phosphoheptulonate synthase n=1 Tax=Acidaminobacter sp. TaxID=1872102 RepID=UPI00137EC3AF|nr:3-deoxy-7-phosphoheptulonate synthase [Acidaminobacter sp.]MDK9710716.1 3-deoxy-7-phosphoheptulonate synthase [Acidaminobacter sp.]MZQ97419.1 3-deoxy-7-phosphoheptulonate synthase [Acidaminobacter sp.]